MPPAPTTQVGHREKAHAAFPVVEIFGPTVQGEGPDAGVPAYFVRFGGCDFRCAWCDSMHAVEPALVRSSAEHMTSEQILERLAALPAGPRLVVLSGGNPALLNLTSLVEDLQAREFAIAVETQGSRWCDWLTTVQRLVVSPKPPSSGMASANHVDGFRRFMANSSARTDGTVLKIVVFDASDLEWAIKRHQEYPGLPLYLSAGTDTDLDDSETLDRLRHRYRWLCETVAHRPELSGARVLPQLHVIAWGTAKGV